MENEYIIKADNKCFKVAKDLKEYVDNLKEEKKELENIVITLDREIMALYNKLKELKGE